MIVIKRLAGASIWSEDLHNLLPFYRDVLGLPVSIESPGFVVLGDPNGVSLGLGTHSEVQGRTREPARHMVGFESDDVVGECARLKAAGVEFIEEPNQQEGMWIATCKDPEGNFVQLFQFE
jgi:predicted enzyme related to lactoylglutathione lyase